MPPKRDREEDADVPDDAKCSICLEIFTDPISLQCGHSLCRACVEPMARTSPAGTMMCPECRASTTLPPGGVVNLKTNIALRNVIARSASAPAPSLFRLCHDHQHERDMFCETCNANICRGCLEDHRGHILDDLRHNADGFMARMQPVIANAKQTMVARLARLRDVHKQALDAHDKAFHLYSFQEKAVDVAVKVVGVRWDMAAAAVQKARDDYESALQTREKLQDTVRSVKGLVHKAKTDYDAVHAENDSFDQNATTLVGALRILGVASWKETVVEAATEAEVAKQCADFKTTQLLVSGLVGGHRLTFLTADAKKNEESLRTQLTAQATEVKAKEVLLAKQSADLKTKEAEIAKRLADLKTKEAKLKIREEKSFSELPPRPGLPPRRGGAW